MITFYGARNWIQARAYKNADQKHRCHAIYACKREDLSVLQYKTRKHKIMGGSFFKWVSFLSHYTFAVNDN